MIVITSNFFHKKYFITNPPGYDELPTPVGETETQGMKISRRHSMDPHVIQTLELDIIRALSDSRRNTTRGPLSDDVAIDSSETSFTMETIRTQSPTRMEQTPHDIVIQEPEKEAKQAQSRKCCPTQVVRRPFARGPISAYSIQNNCSTLLPPPSLEDTDKITLVIDLDETLVHSSFMAIPNSDYSFVIGVDTNQLSVYVLIRPGAIEFLKVLGSLYEIVIFTASSQYYADQVINFLDQDKNVKHRLYRESCTDFNGCQVKDLSKLGRALERIIIIDNSSIAYLLHPYNAIPISSWYDEPGDRELHDIQEFLVENHNVKNIYDILVENP